MARNFNELRAKMSPEAQARSKQRAQEMLRQIEEEKAKGEQQAEENSESK